MPGTGRGYAACGAAVTAVNSKPTLAHPCRRSFWVAAISGYSGNIARTDHVTALILRKGSLTFGAALLGLFMNFGVPAASHSALRSWVYMKLRISG
ncbi:hypothetical protein OE88DRAFT_1667580 [Heliocybe sulcata]|uniref:Uncharacterized protein n=1 Tax=Heliocybe sulcata TaxID=5364 RepID=A0A5C3MQC4_9AGAM|nr:hypothetical protein OE88DRAFT_1667580 [Heliocybe sulcata]